MTAGSYFVAVANAENKIANVQFLAAKNYGLAEAGVNEMIWKIKNDQATGNAFFSGTLNSGFDISRTNIFDDSRAAYQVGAKSQGGSQALITATSTYQISGNDYSQRVIKVTIKTRSGGTSFNYGVQIGNGGITMKGQSKIIGNIYSNAGITGQNPAEITGDAWVAGAGELKNLIVGGDVHAHTITNCAIAGDAYYYSEETISGSTVTGTSNPNSEDPETQPFPLADSTIASWQETASQPEPLQGDYLIDSGSASLGPIKIIGNLTIEKSAKITLTGPVWVTGNVTLKNSGALEISSSYGEQSEVLIADGLISVENTFTVCGSEGFNAATNDCNAPIKSYVLLISTNSANPAISKENATALRGVLYAANGGVFIKNHVNLSEVTAKYLTLENFSEITYESGLASMFFSSGPGGSWEISDWQESY